MSITKHSGSASSGELVAPSQALPSVAEQSCSNIFPTNSMEFSIPGFWISGFFSDERGVGPTERRRAGRRIAGTGIGAGGARQRRQQRRAEWRAASSWLSPTNKQTTTTLQASSWRKHWCLLKPISLSQAVNQEG